MVPSFFSHQLNIAGILLLQLLFVTSNADNFVAGNNTDNSNDMGSIDDTLISNDVMSDNVVSSDFYANDRYNSSTNNMVFDLRHRPSDTDNFHGSNMKRINILSGNIDPDNVAPQGDHNHQNSNKTDNSDAGGNPDFGNRSVKGSLTTYMPNLSGSGERKLSRGKRYLQFAKGSRISWRTNVKNNILAVNTLWGYGFGFRANFPFPGPEESRRPFFKRDVLHALVDVLDGHGLDGRACMLKSYCTAALDAHTNIGGGMLFKMLQITFRVGLDGQACILKAFCIAHTEEQELERRQNGRPGMLLNLLKYIFTLDTHDKRHFPYLRMENCQQILHSHCPLSFNSISPYTDDV